MKSKRLFNQILKPYKTILKEITGDYTTVRVSIDTGVCLLLSKRLSTRNYNTYLSKETRKRYV